MQRKKSASLLKSLLANFACCPLSDISYRETNPINNDRLEG